MTFGGLHTILLFVFNALLIIATPLIRGPGNYLAFTLIFLSTNLLILSFTWQAIKTEKIEIVLSSLSALSFVFLGVILISLFFTINPPSTRYGFFTMASVIINGAFLSFIGHGGIDTKGDENATQTVAQAFRLDNSLKAKALSYRNPITLFSGQRPWQGLCLVLVLAISALSIMALYQYITGHGSFEARGHATFVNPNSFAGYLLLTLPILIGLYLASGKRRHAAAFFSLTLLCFGAILTTGTGGRWIILSAAVATALTLFWIFAATPSTLPLVPSHQGRGIGERVRVRGVRSRLIILAIGFLAVLLIFSLLLGKSATSFSPDPATISGSTHDRLNIWKSAWEVIKEHPIRGSGFWSFHTIYPKYKNRIYKDVEHYFSHNDYLQLWAELGIIGVGVFLLLILVYFREGFRCLKALPLPPQGTDFKSVPIERLSPSVRGIKGEVAPADRAMLLSTLIGSFLLLVHTISDFDLYIPSILFIFWGYIAYASSAARELGFCKTKVIDLNQFRIFTLLGKKKLYIITAGIFAFLSLWVSDPYLAGLYNERGKGYLAKGEYEKAVKFLSKAVELDSIDDSYHFNLGMALAKYSSEPAILKKAEGEMKKAMAIAPYRSDIYFNMAIFYRSFYMKEKGDIAVAMLQKARELDPVDTTITYNLAMLYLELERYKDAINELKKYLEEKPDDAEARIELSGAYRMNKEYDNAIKEIDWVIGKTLTSFQSPPPLSPPIKGGESPSPLVGEGRGEGYVRSNNNYFHFLKANILQDMKRYDDAYGEYQLAMREKGKESEVWYAIGELFLKQNKPKEAEMAFRKAVEYKSLLDQTKNKD